MENSKEIDVSMKNTVKKRKKPKDFIQLSNDFLDLLDGVSTSREAKLVKRVIKKAKKIQKKLG